MELFGKKTVVRDVFFVIIGTLMIALSVNWVFDPNGMVTGGVTGLAIAVKYLTGFIFDGGVPVWLTNILCNIPLFIAALFVLGKKFTLRSLGAMLGLTVWLYLIPVQNMFDGDILLSAIFGGAMAGLGMGFVLMTMSTTGGTDLMAMLIHEKKKHISVPMLLLFVDGLVVVLGVFVFGINKALYGIIAIYISAKVSDGILEGVKFAKVAFIISDEYEQISADILNLVDRGVTALSATGMYSKSDKKLLFCVVSKKEIVGVMEIVHKIDPKAFVIVNDVREVLGEGFIEYKQ
ncbi:MAG: YitT family protein [Clostridiales bacterium]|nr:YitT family protein [Clostridiales bacterium]